MRLYSRRQLVLLLVVLTVAGVGLGVGHWRRSHPDVAARLEQLDVPASPNDAHGAGETQPAGGGTGTQRGTHHDRSDRAAHEHEARARTGGRDARRPAPKLARGQEHVQPLDLNRATGVELTRLPGVGPVLAERILAARDASGTFRSVDDLRHVRGVGSVKLDRLRALVTVGAVVDGGADPMVH